MAELPSTVQIDARIAVKKGERPENACVRRIESAGALANEFQRRANSCRHLSPRPAAAHQNHSTPAGE